MVRTNNVMKYMTRIGQNTGIFKKSKKVQQIAISVAFVMLYQNLNSGRRLMKGRNSSFTFVGRDSPSSINEKKATHKHSNGKKVQS